MSQILTINSKEVKIGEDDGSVTTVPRSALQFEDPMEGDRVQVFRDGDDYIVKRTNSAQTFGGVNADGTRSYNKHLFVWVFTFLVGGFGVDRFMRGQVGLGVFKLLLCLFGWVLLLVGGFAGWIWCMADWIIAMTKAYGAAYGADENVTFDENGNYTK